MCTSMESKSRRRGGRLVKLERSGNSDGTRFIAGLAGVGVEGGEGQLVDGALVHGEEDFAGIHI